MPTARHLNYNMYKHDQQMLHERHFQTTDVRGLCMIFVQILKSIEGYIQKRLS